MKKVVAFGASNSTRSINQQFANWVSSQIKDTQVNHMDLNDYEMHIYSIDREQRNGIPDKAHLFKNTLREADGIIISFSEHNGGFTAAFKNIYDWASRIERSMWLNKPMFLLSTSPGPRGAKNVLSTAVRDFPHRGGQIVASFSLPSFKKNFTPDNGIIESELRNEFEKQLENFKRALHEAKNESSTTI